MRAPDGTYGKAGFFFILFLIIASTGLRLWLPHWAKGYVNAQIDALDGYGGTVDDIGISLWRGAYQIYGLDIYKDKGGLKKPFVSAETIDLSVEWKALLRGRVVAEADIANIGLNFAVGQTGAGGGWGRFVDALSPFEINRLGVSGGKIAYLDYRPSPDVDIHISGISGEVTNLRNVERRDAALPSDLRLAGTSVGKGAFRLAGRVNIMQDVPDFDLDIRLENAALAAFNDYARAAAAVDFEKGAASLYSELAAADGKVTGYLKIIIIDVALVDLDDKDQNVIKAVWETLVGGFMTLFKNQPQDQFALRIPIQGSLRNPDRDTWAAFLSIFSNAFGKAFSRDTDGNINFRDALEGGG